MNAPDDLYRPPRSDDGAAASEISAAEWRRTAKVFVGRVIGGSLLSGAVEALRVGDALSHFDAVHYLPGVVTLWALRTGSTGVVASAAVVACAIAIHRRAAASTVAPRAPVPGAAFLVLPIATPGAACVIIATAVAVGGLAFGVSIETCREEIRGLVRLEDPLVGVSMACLFVMVFSEVAPVAGRLLGAMRGRVVTKVVVALVVTNLTVALVDALVIAAFEPNDDSAIPGAEGRQGPRSVIAAKGRS